MKRFALFVLLVALSPAGLLIAADTVTSTRVGAFDFQTQDANGVKIADYARPDTAIVACVNNPACVYVQGGRYKYTRTTSTPPPPPASGTALTSWVAPTQYTDGSALTNLAGFKVYHGTSAAALTDVRQVAAGVLSFSFTGLPSGTHYFAVTAVTATGAESALSTIGTKTVP